MVTSQAATAEEYVAALPPDRRASIEAVRRVILEHLPDGYREGMQYGMLGYYVPLDRLPDTYNGQPLSYVALANQKHHMSLYLNSVYGDAQAEGRLRDAFAAAGKKLDMGKSCVRFRSLDDLPLDAIGAEIGRASVEEFIARYRAARAGVGRG